jgi:hypothetical protein
VADIFQCNALMDAQPDASSGPGRGKENVGFFAWPCALELFGRDADDLKRRRVL